MSIKLIFDGGLFVLLPGREDRHKVDVLMHTPIPVEISGHPDLAKKLNDAKRIDFLSEKGSVLPGLLKLRRVSHTMPVKYTDFKKTVGFNAGKIKYRAEKATPKKEAAIHKKARKTTNPVKQLKHYKKVVPNVKESEEESLLKGIVQSFASTTDVQWWLPGYRMIEVKLPAKTKVVLDGREEPDWPDVVIEFKVDPNSAIPHYPDHNPHVLEQPPTI